MTNMTLALCRMRQSEDALLKSRWLPVFLHQGVRRWLLPEAVKKLKMADEDCPTTIEVMVRQAALFAGLLNDRRNAREIGVRDAWKQVVLNMKIQTAAEEIPKLGIIAPVGGATNHRLRPIASANIKLVDVRIVTCQQ